jgi:hypothetical protein
MSDFENDEQTVLRNMLLGRWAAKILGMSDDDAKAYSEALGDDTFDPKRSDVFSKVRADFEAADVSISDGEILRVMTDLMIEAGKSMPTKRRGSVDGAAVFLKRNLSK